MPIKFLRVDQEYLFFIGETQNPYSAMEGRIHLKDIDRIELIKRYIERPEIATGLSQVDWGMETVNAVGKILTGILLFALLIALAG